ncbi:MAG: leucine-rich repeat domain-containing protein [Muribaculaceae bacterium]|nr:leucine-rich repeat domain-containing protein [Muribaculaceae bacterium]
MKRFLLLTTALTAISPIWALTVDVRTAGTLPELIGENKYDITELTLTGELNGTDIRFLREMAGSDVSGAETEGQLSSLNMAQAVIVPGGDSYFTSATYGDMFTEQSYISPYMFFGCTALTDFTMPEDVEILGMAAFTGCPLSEFGFSPVLRVIGPNVFEGSMLTEVILPESVTEIWNLAFRGSSQLRRVTIGAEVYGIDLPFYDCPALESITVSADNPYFRDIDGVLVNSEYTIIQYPNAKASDYIIPDEIEAIGTNAFTGCNNLESITFGSDLLTVGERAFERCASLRDITFNENILEILPYAFQWCEALKAAIFPDSLYEIREGAFTASGIETLRLGEGLYSIGNNAFADCGNLTTVVFPSVPLHEMGEGVFARCHSMIINDFGGLTYIPPYTFTDCAALTDIKIPDTITEIGEGAFSNCTGIETIDFGNGVTSIGAYALSNCTGLREFNVPDQVTYLGDGVASNCIGLERIKIGNGVPSLGSWMFCYCASLTDVELGDGLTSTGEGTFSGCDALQHVKLGANITDIGDFCFGYCYQLSEFDFPEGIERIGTYTFSSTPLSSITLPSTLGNLGSGAFAYCQNLTEVRCEATEPPVCEWGVFNMIPEDATLIVPEGSLEAYREAEEWKNFFNIETGVKMSISDGSIKIGKGFADVPEGISCTVYTTDGRKVTHSDNGGRIYLPTGLYVIRTATAASCIAIK